ncbi:flagellar hook-associated family protein [Microvirga terricola]|uniref:Flagellin n=1 Tax=Microvirga terricola TaxID=2719797 RepID=A0ABX0VEZ5_9HYPH|nr:flagellar hook-associated family protein [Microvirga terricola]NIX78414.1 flagellar hook-associated family protein [Microvirga terricola]
MKTSFISTLNLWNSPRSAVNKLQADLAKANQEIVTGRHADVGLALGSRTGQAITLRQERAELDALIDSNGTVSLRLGGTKSALDNIRTSAESFLNSLLSVPPLERGAKTVQDGAKIQLTALVSELNKSTGGQYIFAGTNTKQKPVTEYTDVPPSATKAAVDAAFMAAFGVSQTDPAAFNITAAQMDTFLNGAFATLFDPVNWQGTWSSASNQNIESRISATEKIETSTNANQDAMRNLAMAYTMAADLGLSGLRTEAQQVIVDKMISTLGYANNGVVDIQAQLGTAEKRVTEANERMGLQKNILDQGVGRLEEVDPGEAKTRVDALTTQIQMSYSLTSQLRQISLINYL